MGADADIVRRLTEEVFVGGKLEVIDELIADDFVSHDPPPGIAPTKAGFRELAEMVITSMSDRKTDPDEFIDTADGRVVENWTMTGRHTGEVFGLPPSNQDVVVRGMEIFRCEGGKIVEHWGVVDLSDVFMKAGPPPG